MNNQWGEETEQERKEREQAEFEWSERNEEALREAKGEPPLDPFYGIDKGGDYSNVDDANSPLDDSRPGSPDEIENIDDYQKYIEQFPDQEPDMSAVAASEARARKIFPGYDDFVDTHLGPLAEKCREQNNPLFQRICNSPDPAMAVLKLAYLVKYHGSMTGVTRRLNSLSREQMDKISGEDFGEFLRWAVNPDSEELEDNAEKEIEAQRRDRANMKRMNRLGIKDFEAALDRKWKW